MRLCGPTLLVVVVTSILGPLQASNAQENAPIRPNDGAIVDDRVCSYQLSKLTCEPAGLCAYQFRFGDLTPSQSCRLKTSDVGPRPQQLHLAFAGREPGTAMTISWTTYTKVDDSAVWIGADPANLELSSATVEVQTYYRDEKYSLFNYHATVVGLAPSTTYSYRVGSRATEAHRSDVSNFSTARATTDPSEFEVAMYGDFGVDKNAAATVKYVNEHLRDRVDFVFHVGDISYADNAGILTPSEAVGFFYEETYNQFMNLLAPLLPNMPYMVLVGNHEAECHSPACMVSNAKKDQLGNYNAYNARFRMPSAESGGAKNMWYSFQHGPVHFTTISSETDFANAPNNSHTGRVYGGFGNQLAWLEADLDKANANRTNTPWLIVMMHRAIYTRTMCDADGVPIGEAAPIQQAFEDLFIKYRVDVVVAGHVHLYSRHFPIKKNKPVMEGVSEDRKVYTNPKAPVYIITGAAGSSEGHKKFDPNQKISWNAVINNQDFGISNLKVSRNKLQWQFISVESRKILDEFSMIKN